MILTGEKIIIFDGVEYNIEPTIFPVFFPIIQRIAARTLGQDLVSVQPMSKPFGRIFYTKVRTESPTVFTTMI